MRSTTMFLALGILVVGAAFSLEGCAENITASDLAGVYSLSEYTYDTPDGQSVVLGPPDYSGFIDLQDDKTYSLSLNMGGSAYAESGTFVVETTYLGVVVKLHPSTGGESIGSAFQDNLRKYFFQIKGYQGWFTFIRQ